MFGMLTRWQQERAAARMDVARRLAELEATNKRLMEALEENRRAAALISEYALALDGVKADG